MLNDVVSKFIARENLLQKNCNYLVALSGGADSVALLRVLISLGYKVCKPFLLALCRMMCEAFPENPCQLILPSRFLL